MSQRARAGGAEKVGPGTDKAVVGAGVPLLGSANLGSRMIFQQQEHRALCRVTYNRMERSRLQAQLVLIQSLTLALNDKLNFDASRLSLNSSTPTVLAEKTDGKENSR